MDDNKGLVTYLQRVCGYALTGDVSEQALFFLHGGGANGKSVFLGTIKGLLGDYAQQAVSELLMQKHNESHPTERADLRGRRFVATVETDEGKKMAEALMKQLTGGDSVSARRMREDFFEMIPTWKIFLAANHQPTIQGTDYAVWRRIKLIPFNVQIPVEEQDKQLLTKLRREWPGILAWAVRGCRDWQWNGLGEPEEVRAATQAYKAEQDTIQGFINDCCFVHPNVRVRSSILFEAFQKWSGDKVMTSPQFRKRMKEKGLETEEGTGGRYYYSGIGLHNSTNEVSD